MPLNVTNFDPIVESILFFIFLFITLSLMVKSSTNYSKFSSYGKTLYILSFVPLLLLLVYFVQHGYWIDEIPRLNKYFIQESTGSGTENFFLTASCLLNILAMHNKKLN